MKLFAVLLAIIFASGHFVTGQTLPSGPQVLTYFSEVDDTDQPYGLYIPENYKAEKKYPLVIMLHGSGSNHRLALRRVFGKSNMNGETDVEATRYYPEWPGVEYIVATPYGRGTNGYQGISEKDVLDVLANVKKRFNIDEDRTYLTGLSMGGGGTLWIGLTRPDLWAALAPVCPSPPKGADHLVLNGFNVPMHFFHGDADKAVPVSVSRDWVKRLKETGANISYTEYPGVEHNSWENAYKDQSIFAWFSKFKRNLYPEQVKFSSTQYEYNKAFWVRFDMITPGTVATIDATLNAPNRLAITTTNLNAFTLDLARHPNYKSEVPLDITLNGKRVKSEIVRDSVSFLFQNGKWAVGSFQRQTNSKEKGLEGPIPAAISDRHIYVYGTGGNPSPDELRSRMEIAAKAANWSAYRNAFLGRVMVFPRVLSDKEMRPSDFESSNLVLFGSKETNTIIEKFSDQLPLELKKTDRKIGLLYIFPMNGRYILINDGLPWWEGEPSGGPRPRLPFQMLNGLKDYVVYEDKLGNVITDGFFNDRWELNANEEESLIKINLFAE